MVMIALLAVVATTSAFAWSASSDVQSTTTNQGPTNQTGSVSVLTLNVASSVQVVSSYTFASYNASSPAGATAQLGSVPTSVRVMYQQWRHDQQNDWFYLYAINSAAAGSLAAPVWDYYYYNPTRGATRFGASQPNNSPVIHASYQAGTTPVGGAVASTAFVYLTSGTTQPAFAIDSSVANSSRCFDAVGANCSISFTSELRWGLAQQGFRDEGGSGTFKVQQSVESFGRPSPVTSSILVYYSAWVDVATGASTISLGDNAPAQAASGVTNASGARNVNTASSYTSNQTVTDADGDISGQWLIWVATAGLQQGQWFSAGAIQSRSTGGLSNATTYTVVYSSWNESAVYTTPGSQLTTNYLTNLAVNTVSQTSGTRGTNSVGSTLTDLTSQTLQYAYIYGTNARGTWQLYGRAEDWHGRSSGNVAVGTGQTVS